MLTTLLWVTMRHNFRSFVVQPTLYFESGLRPIWRLEAVFPAFLPAGSARNPEGSPRNAVLIHQLASSERGSPRDANAVMLGLSTKSTPYSCNEAVTRRFSVICPVFCGTCRNAPWSAQTCFLPLSVLITQLSEKKQTMWQPDLCERLERNMRCLSRIKWRAHGGRDEL